MSRRPPASGPRPGSGPSPSALPTAVIAGKWRVTRFLGAGSFGHVFAGENIQDPSAPLVALKRALTQSDKPTNQPSVGVDYLAAELAGLRQITAAGGAPDSLPKLFSDELIETPRGLIMVMSCHGPALASVKKALMVARMGGNEWGVSEMTASDKVVPGMGLDVEVVVEIGRQLAETLDWIHKQGLVYCDMKLANIVLRHPNPPFTSPNFPADIVLIDHGLIRPIKPPQSAQQSASASSVGSQPNEPQRNDRIGTPRYASISMHRGHPPTPSSDFESLAYTLFDLTLSHLPWTKVDAKPGPATWQAISRAKSHMTEHEWSILLGERDPLAASARFANTLIALWDAAHLARPRYAGRFNWEQVFVTTPMSTTPVALWKGVPAHVLDIVDKELAHAHA
ncbi:kinase-like domain-containing protein, partial [Catenaria anguillulae PL171]